MTWATFWDAATAIGTIAMAVTTGVVIRQNKRQRQEAARQHHDAFKPVCGLVPEKGLANPHDRCDFVQCVDEATGNIRYYRVNCDVKNIGSGPAMNLRLLMRFSTSRPEVPPRVEMEMLGAKQSLPSPILVRVYMQDSFNQASYQVAPNEVWELWLIYEDIFGNVFHTRHTKNPREPWARFGTGDMR